MNFRKSLFTTALFLFGIMFVTAAAHAQTGFKGKVRDGDGKGIANANITVRQDGKDLRSVTTDSKGHFEISGLHTGEYNVVFDATGYNVGLLSKVEAKEGKIRDLGDRLILMVDPATLIFVRGSVFTKDGHIIRGAKVELFAIDGNGSAKKVGTSYSNSAGEFGFRHPEGPTKMRVTATFKGETGSKDIEIDVAAVYRTAVSIDISKK